MVPSREILEVEIGSQNVNIIIILCILFSKRAVSIYKITRNKKNNEPFKPIHILTVLSFRGHSISEPTELIVFISLLLVFLYVVLVFGFL